MNITWGMVGNSHDASLAVFDDKELLWASLAKDFSKVPNDPDFSQMQIDVAIQSFGHPRQFNGMKDQALKHYVSGEQDRVGFGKENNIRSYLERWSINVPITYTQHHLSHAAYAYYTQPHDDCAVVCLDSIGEFETLTVWHGKNNKLKKLYSQGYPHSLGLFYSAMTQRIGLIPNRDEYLVTEWAAKGNGIYLMHDMLQELVKVNQDSNKPSVRMRENLHRGCRWWKPELTSKQDMYDIAAATQAVFEYCVKLLSNYAHYKTNHGSAIAFAGGGALK